MKCEECEKEYDFDDICGWSGDCKNCCECSKK